MKPLILGLLAAVALVVTLLGMFSTPIGKRRQQQVAEHRTPNLGRPLAIDPLLPAQDPSRSVTPLMGADLRSRPDTSHGLVTASDLQGSSTRNPLPNLSPAPSPSHATSMAAPLSLAAVPPPSGGNPPGGTNGRYALGRIEFSDLSGERKESLAEVESRIAKLESQANAGENRAVGQQISESLAKPSLVYVHNPSFGSPATAPGPLNTNLQDSGDSLHLPTGMRLITRFIGIYGVISYTVSQRRREIGIRLALGAQQGELKRMFVRQGLMLAGMGVAIGLGAAAGLMRLMKSLLFGISPLDPLTYAAVPVVLVAAAVLASYLPARRAE